MHIGRYASIFEGSTNFINLKSRTQPVGDERRVDGLAAGSVDDVGVERVGQVPKPDQMINKLV